MLYDLLLEPILSTQCAKMKAMSRYKLLHIFFLFDTNLWDENFIYWNEEFTQFLFSKHHSD